MHVPLINQCIVQLINCLIFSSRNKTKEIRIFFFTPRPTVIDFFTKLVPKPRRLAYLFIQKNYIMLTFSTNFKFSNILRSEFYPADLNREESNSIPRVTTLPVSTCRSRIQFNTRSLVSIPAIGSTWLRSARCLFPFLFYPARPRLRFIFHFLIRVGPARSGVINS